MNNPIRVSGILSVWRAAVAGLIVGLLLTRSASAAISDGPVLTNAYALRQHQKLLFDQAVASNQDRLRVGQERYDRKQMDRAKMLQAMTAQLQARRQTVSLQPTMPAGGLAVMLAGWQKPVFATLLVAIIFSCLAFIFRQRVSDKDNLSQN